MAEGELFNREDGRKEGTAHISNEYIVQVVEMIVEEQDEIMLNKIYSFYCAQVFHIIENNLYNYFRVVIAFWVCFVHWSTIKLVCDYKFI